MVICSGVLVSAFQLQSSQVYEPHFFYLVQNALVSSLICVAAPIAISANEMERERIDFWGGKEKMTHHIIPILLFCWLFRYNHYKLFFDPSANRVCQVPSYFVNVNMVLQDSYRILY